MDHYNPAATINPYPTVTIVIPAKILLGTPLVKKCLTRRYRTPVSGTSIMIAAVFVTSALVPLSHTGKTGGGG